MPAIAIIGIDGSGKSSVSIKTAELLSAACPAYLVSDRLYRYQQGRPGPLKAPLAEPVREKIGSYAKKARSIRHYKLPKLAELLLRDHIIWAIEKKHQPPYLVLDGSPLLNIIAWARLYNEKDFTTQACQKAVHILTGHTSLVDKTDPVYRLFPELALLKKLRINRFHLPGQVVFLDVAPEIALQRITGRGKRVQVHETAGKLGSLRQAYRMECAVLREKFGIPVRIIDGNTPFAQITESMHRFLTGGS